MPFGGDQSARGMCWTSDNRLLVGVDTTLVILDTDIENDSCNTTIHEHANFYLQSISCSDGGKAYVVPRNSDEVYIYKDGGKPETWTPDVPLDVIKTISVNKNFIVLSDWSTDYRQLYLYVYSRNKDFLYKFPNVDSSREYSVCYLSEDNFLWCSPTGAHHQTVYDINTNTSVRIDGATSLSTTGLGQYVALSTGMDIMVYYQNGTFSHVAVTDVPIRWPDKVSVRGRHQQTPLLAVTDSDMHAHVRLYDIDLTTTEDPSTTTQVTNLTTTEDPVTPTTGRYNINLSDTIQLVKC